MLYADGHGVFRRHCGQVCQDRCYTLYTDATESAYRPLGWGPHGGELWVGYGSMRLSDWAPGWYVLDFERPGGGIRKLLVHIIEKSGAQEC